MELAQLVWANLSTNSLSNPPLLRQKHPLASASVSADGLRPLKRAGHPGTDQFLKSYAVITTDYNIARFKQIHVPTPKPKSSHDLLSPTRREWAEIKTTQQEERSEIVRKPCRKVFHIIQRVLTAFPSVSEKGGWMLTEAPSALL